VELWTRSQSAGISLARLWALGIKRAQFETGAAGTSYFEPDGVIFWDSSKIGSPQEMASGHVNRT
jgi:hypothetical protein